MATCTYGVAHPGRMSEKYVAHKELLVHKAPREPLVQPALPEQLAQQGLPVQLALKGKPAHKELLVHRGQPERLGLLAPLVQLEPRVALAQLVQPERLLGQELPVSQP